jgi:hypothetical protein
VPTPVSLPSTKLGVDIHSLLWDGVEAGIREGLEREAGKRGMMRGASQGLWLDAQTIVGVCHRAAQARMLGGEPTRPDDWLEKQLMFDSGHANEDSWVANLKRSWRGEILREEELPIEWRIQKADGDGEVVGSGREDIILCLPDGEPGGVEMRTADGRTVRVAQFLELKQISSVNTATDVLFAGGKPKLQHAIQVGRYTLEHKVPAQIWYTLPFVCPVPNWSFIQSRVPAQGEKFSERVNYGRDGKPSKIQPCAVGYHLAWHGGVLHYCRVGAEEDGWFPTIVTEAGLDDFWAYTVDMPVTRQLGPRPTNMDIHGNREVWSMCDYCDWRETCDAHEDDYGAWESAVMATVPDIEPKKE